MPHHPGLENPTIPEPPATFIDFGRAEESGRDKFFKDKVAPPTAVKGLTDDAPWNALFRINSAYRPPSPP
jgi:hypothetical protein